MQTSENITENYSPGNTYYSRTESNRENSENLQMTSMPTRKGAAHVQPLLFPISPGTSMQCKAVLQSHRATPNHIDDRDSLFSDLSAPLTDKHREKLSRLDELYASHDSANGSLNDHPHFRDEDLFTPRWSNAVQSQQCPAKLTGWSPSLSDYPDMKRGSSLSPRGTLPDDEDGYSVYSDWDSYHLTGDRTRTRPRMTEAGRRDAATQDAFNRLSCVISCAPVAGTNPEVPLRSGWGEASFWTGLPKNGGSSVEQKYDPACPTDNNDFSAVRTDFQRAEPRTTPQLAGNRDFQNSRPQGNDSTAFLPRKDVNDLRGNTWRSWETVHRDTKHQRTDRNEDERKIPRSGSDHRRRGTHSRSRSRHTSPRQSFRSRRIAEGGAGDRWIQRHSQRYRTLSEGEKSTSMFHLENKSPRDTTEGQNNNDMLSEKEFLRIVRLIHSGQLERAMHKTLVQIIPEVIGRHSQQSSVNIEEVSQDAKDIVWQLKLISPAASFPQILSALPFLRKLFFQFKLPTNTSPQDVVHPSSERRPSTLSPERRRPDPENGSSSQRCKHRRERDTTPDLYPISKFRRHSTPDRRRSESRRAASHGRSTPRRPSTRYHRPLATPREWLGRRVFRSSRYAFVRQPQTVHRRYLLRKRTSAVHPRDMISRSRNVGRLPRRITPSERLRPEERGPDREGHHRRSPSARNLVSHRRGATLHLRPKVSRRGGERNRKNVSADGTSKPLTEIRTAMNSTKDRDSSEISTHKTNVSKGENVAQETQFNNNTTDNRKENPAKSLDSNNPMDPSIDRPRLATSKTTVDAQLKPPSLLSCTVAIPRKITPLLDVDLVRKPQGIEIPQSSCFLPRRPLLSTPPPSSAHPYEQPLFPISPCLNYSSVRQPTRWPHYNGNTSWKLPSPSQLIRPSGGNHVRSGVRPFR